MVRLGHGWSGLHGEDVIPITLTEGNFVTLSYAQIFFISFF